MFLVFESSDLDVTYVFCLQVNFIVDLINEYLPSIVMTLANFITPLLFSVIITYEDYSPAFEIRFTLMRYSEFPNTKVIPSLQFT